MTHLTGRIADPTIQPAIHCNEDLPADIRRELPPMIQDIFRNAYNLAKSQEAGGDLAIQSGDERAREKAWGAVRCAYTQIGTTWVLNRAA